MTEAQIAERIAREAHAGQASRSPWIVSARLPVAEDGWPQRWIESGLLYRPAASARLEAV